MNLSSFSETKEFLYGFIPKDQQKLFVGDWGIERTTYFLSLLGNPHKKIRLIHIAGTSGKGSTVTLLSMLLAGIGFKVGLHISPHIIDIRERIQINNILLSKEVFTTYLNQLVPIIREVEKSQFGKPSYFEVLTVLAFYIFWKEKVDYAVIETGLGGLLDATNVGEEKNKLVILTKIGLDHTKVLGKTIGAIAQQKAGIIHTNNMVISAWQKLSAREVIDRTVLAAKGKLIYIKSPENFLCTKITSVFTEFNFHLTDVSFRGLRVSLLGKYQAENCSLALSGLCYLSKRDGFTLDEKIIRNILIQTHFNGRLHLLSFKGKDFVLDGAHNPPKMRAFTHSLKEIYPDQKFDFIVAFSAQKDFMKMLSYIIPIAKKITITTFTTESQEMAHASQDPHHIAEALKKFHFAHFSIVRDTEKAIFSGKPSAPHTRTVITGSLYLMGKVYELCAHKEKDSV